MGIGNMLKAIANVECGLVGQKIRDPESGRQDEVELAMLFRNFPAKIGPKGTSGEFDIGPDSIRCDEGEFDFWGEADAVREMWLLKLDIDCLCAE